MKKLAVIVAATSLLLSFNAFAQDARDVADARKAAESWMKLVDAEEYSAAWNVSSEGMRKGMPKLAWNMLASTVHLPLGTLKSRTLKSTDVKPGAAGKPASVSIEYSADYENSRNVRENITTVRDSDGVWRVAGFTLSSDESKQAK